MMLNADVRKGGGWSNADTCGQGGGGMKRGHFLRTSFMDDPLWLEARGRSLPGSLSEGEGLSIGLTLYPLFMPLFLVLSLRLFRSAGDVRKPRMIGALRRD